MQDDVIFTQKEKNLLAHLGCEIDHHTARRMRERIDNRLFLEKPTTLTLDFSSVTFMDSSGVGLILGRVETASALGATVCISGASPSVVKLLRLAGIERVRNLTIIS